MSGGISFVPLSGTDATPELFETAVAEPMRSSAYAARRRESDQRGPTTVSLLRSITSRRPAARMPWLHAPAKPTFSSRHSI